MPHGHEFDSHRAQFFLARGSVNVRRTVVGPYRVRSKVSKIVIVIEKARICVAYA